MRLILGSGSPRRKKILDKFFNEFEIISSNVSETTETENPKDHVLTNAKRKCHDIQEANDGIIISADTIAAHENKILEKPENDNHARKMLKKLSGDPHKVITGYCISDPNKEITDHVVTEVKFRDLSKKEINEYVSTEEPMDKAGSYAIQGKGSILVERINGDYYNVMGFPIRIVRDLRRFGIDPLNKATTSSNSLF